MMRLSSFMMHRQGLDGILDSQARLGELQQQLATGKKLNKAADDPAAAAVRLDVKRSIADAEQYNRNGERLRSRLGMEENALADLGNLLTRVEELTLQAANATQSNDSRRMIGVEVEQIREQLLELANSRDESQRYLFGGYSSESRPFVENGGVVEFRGDGGVRKISVGPSRDIADGDSGVEVFMAARSGNGRINVTEGSNSGNLSLRATALRDQSLWVPDDYTLSFDATGNWSASDGGGNVVGSGPYAEGEAISFRGVEITLAGSPAAGDSFTVQPSSSVSIFDVVDRLAETLKTPVNDETEQASLLNTVHVSLDELANTQDHFLEVRATVGARLNALDSQMDANEDSILEFRETLSGLEDLNYAEAITELNVRMTALQAAQQSYLRIRSSNLFDYLR